MISLNGVWKFKAVQDENWLDISVPTTVNTELLAQHVIKDPFYRENEAEIKALSYSDYEFIKQFECSVFDLNHQKIMLDCEGIDTLGCIYINDVLVQKVENQHRHYECEVKSVLNVGMNTIYIKLYSPLRYIEKRHEEKSLWGVATTLDGYQHLRKAHSMFGWDWGPQLPDTGIFRSMSLQCYDDVRLNDLYVVQTHHEQSVDLTVEVEASILSEGTYQAACTLLSPQQNVVYQHQILLQEETAFTFCVNHPELWWPNGLGKQPLYEVVIEVFNEEVLISTLRKRIGLRSLTVRKKHDEYGVGFCFEINGHDMFSMGANYIPEDSVLGRCSYDKTKLLLQQCVASNFNTIRVWGGGLYPESYFYDLCDELGLVVWQDFMFACAVYELSDQFRENIISEVSDNIRRFRNHASLGLWCGNNEMEMGWESWGIPDNKKLREDYLEMFERLIPELVKKLSPQTFYWPASPSSEGGFIDPNKDDRGDAHYWDVWHGKKPFEDFENYYFRFASEYGFQSFPSLKTIQTFTTDADLNIYSPVMEHHQKCIDNAGANGNSIIMQYMARYYQMPKDFVTTLYASQILQGDCLQTAIEHFRRHRGRCMGSTYWQLNDCWPVASWATIDYNARLKASHYMVKRSYAPILVSAHYNPKTKQVTVVGVNDTLSDFNGTLSLKLVHQETGVIMHEHLSVIIKALSKKTLQTFEYESSKLASRDIYLAYELQNTAHEVVSQNALLFIEPKQFNFKNPNVTCEIRRIEEVVTVTLMAEQFARHVWVDFTACDVTFDCNCVTLYPKKPMTITVTSSLSDEEFKALAHQVTIMSVYNIAN